MGLWDALFNQKKIYVSSSVYNLAGDEADRPNYLKSSLFAAVMNPHDMYIGEMIVGGYLDGPGIMQRSFFNWSVNNDIAGLPTLKISSSVPIDGSVVSPFITIPASPSGLVNRVQTAEYIDGDYGVWAEKWLFENNPSQIGTDWISDYDAANHEITIQYEGGGSVDIAAGNYDKDKKYIIARYFQVVPSSVEPLVVGTKTTDVATKPDTTDYSLDATVNEGVVTYTLNQTVEEVREYSDGSPTTTTTTTPTVTEDFNTILETWGDTSYLGSTTTAVDTTTLQKWFYIWERLEVFDDPVGTETVVVNDVGGGHTETITTTTTGDFTRPTFDHQLDTQETIEDLVGGNEGIFIYEIGTGNSTLDAVVSSSPDTTAPGYYPCLPLRIDNDSITEPQFSALFDETKKAYKRATGGPMKGKSITALIDEVEDNPDLGDIDYAYLQWGVSVNVFDAACRRYMYEWFSNMIAYQNTTQADMTAFTNSVTNYGTTKTAYDNWTAAQNDEFNPLFGTAKPSLPTFSDPPSTTVRLVSDHAQLSGFDNRFTWINITEETFSGVGQSGATTGDVWFVDGADLSWTITTGVQGRDEMTYTNTDKNVETMYLYKQTGPNSYSRLVIYGMIHENFIYGGKAVKTTLKEGVNDTDESVFIIPLHNPTVRGLGIKDYTQMALSNTFITFNSYKVVKKKWYQTFLGMLLIVIAITVVAALIAPAAVGGAAGIFGTNAAVGGALGLSGTAGIVAGAVTNAIAATVIAQAVGLASNAIFGEKWGPIIGAIVGFAISFGMANGFSSMSLSNMMNPQTILGFANALANGYNGFVQAEIGEINAEMAENKSEFDKATEDLNDLMRSMGLTNDLSFDPLSLTNSVKGNGSTAQGNYLPETLDQFIGRTTMTGSDVVDITLSMVTDYSDLQLTLPKN